MAPSFGDLGTFIPSVVRYGTRLRMALVWYVLSSMVVLQVMSLEEAILGLSVPPWLAFAVALVLVPVPAAVFAWMHTTMSDVDENASDFKVLAYAVGAFAVWVSGYFLVGWLTEGRHMHTMYTAVDDLVPYLPSTIFVYFTVYHAFAAPLLVQDDPDTARIVAMEAAAVMLTDFAIMMLYPVTMARPEPSGPPLSAWFMELLHGADPAHNCFPSSHCSAALFGFLAVLTARRHRLAWYMGFSALAISLSTMTTRQHYAADVLAGWGVALAIHGMFMYKYSSLREED